MVKAHKANGAMVVIGGVLYSFGGRDMNGPHTKESEYFDETSQTWKQTLTSLWLPATEYPDQEARDFAIAVFSDSQAFLFGGADKNNVCRDHVMRVDVSGIVVLLVRIKFNQGNFKF